MKKQTLVAKSTALFLAWLIFAMPLSAFAQTRIVAPKNKYKVEDDVKAGREAAAQVEKQMPILNDAQATRYVQQVGEKLAASIPPEFQHSEFRYTFKIVNASDINAFALPGGPMFVNRGMIEAAKNEGEMAGVMAHELSHVALRHGTAQATQQQKNQLPIIAGVLGGAILGGVVGGGLGQVIAQGSQAITAGLFVLPYSREYETQADVLGSQIMARAGYDPRDLANMFKTIEGEGGNRAPEWLSTHPNPANRYERINQEAALLRVSPEPIRLTPGFENTKRRFQTMPKAQTTAEIEKNNQGNTSGNGNGNGNGNANSGTYSSRVSLPSTSYQTYNASNISVSYPGNWQNYPDNSSVTFAPSGAIGNQGFTHGAMIGVYDAKGNNLQTATNDLAQGLIQSSDNNYLRQQGNSSRGSLSGRNALSSTFSGTSPITKRTELVTLYTTQLSDGNLFYLITVVPQNESSSYNRAFSTMIRSVKIND